MNRFIFDTLAFLNGLLAIIAIGVFTFAGYNNLYMASARPLGALLGLGVGIAVAAVLCGAIAFMALIEQHLRTIAEATLHAGSVPSEARREPTI